MPDLRATRTLTWPPSSAPAQLACARCGKTVRLSAICEQAIDKYLAERGLDQPPIEQLDSEPVGYPPAIDSTDPDWVPKGAGAESIESIESLGATRRYACPECGVEGEWPASQRAPYCGVCAGDCGRDVRMRQVAS